MPPVTGALYRKFILSGTIEVVHGEFHFDGLHVTAFAIHVGSRDGHELTLVADVLTAARGSAFTDAITGCDGDKSYGRRTL